MKAKDIITFTYIIENWHNGNLSAARRRIRTLTKYQVASLLLHGWMSESGRAFIGNRDLEDDFQSFVLASLESKD